MDIAHKVVFRQNIDTEDILFILYYGTSLVERSFFS